MDNPLVSIVIPVYNGANYIREAIDSALAQIYGNCEIIVINDGSSDATEEIVLSYGHKVRYYSKENGGVSTALNMGIEKMRGEYFSWLSHDDMYYPYKIEKQIAALRDCGDMKKIIWGDYDYTDKYGGYSPGRRFSNTYNCRLLTNSVFPVLMSCIGGCGLLIHNSHFDRIGIFNPELKYTQDYEMWFRMFYKQTTVYISEPLYKLRRHDLQGAVTEAKMMRPQEIDLYMWFSRQLTRDDMVCMFGSAYEYYRLLYIKLAAWGNQRAEVSDVFDKLSSEPVPPSVSALASKIKDLFRGITDGGDYKLCVFGAGYYGKRLYYELSTLNINVDFFADNDANKSGSMVLDKVPCLSFDKLREIKNNVLVIAAVANPCDIVEQLRQEGFPFVTTRQEMEGLLMSPINAVPLPKEHGNTI